MSSNRPSKPPLTPSQRRNRTIGVVCGLTFAGMVGASYAAVPLYKAFCEATGYDGTVRRAKVAPDEVLGKTVVIRFDTNVDGLPWDFSADDNNQVIKIGETKVATF